MKEKCSKILSYVLRHAPDEYGILLDKDGWTNIDLLLKSIAVRHPEEFELMSKGEFIMIFGSDKNKRHEVLGANIRAKYGHSITNKILKISSEPPDFLYHGTTKSSISKISLEGLKPMKRQYAHLSNTESLARAVALGKTTSPVVIRVKAKSAYEAGYAFFDEKNVWLSNKIPAEFLIISEAEYTR